MATLVLRSAGSPLTNSQIDANFTNLNNDIQTRATTNSPAFTGTPTGLTKAHVGLGNVDNTADANKPVSTAQATAINAKQDKLTAGANITITNNIISATGSGGSTPLVNDLTTGGTGAALTAEQGKTLKGLVDGKQATLVSNTNIKTVGGQSLLGPGDVPLPSGGGGATLQTGPLVSDPAEAPNAEAVANAIAAAVDGVAAGSIAPIDTPFNSAIPLDKVQGRVMAPYTQASDITLVPANGAVEQGSCSLSIDGDGAHAINISAFVNANNFTPDKTKRNILSCVYSAGVAMIAGIAVTRPIPLPAKVINLAAGNTTQTTQVLTWDAASDATFYIVEYQPAGDSNFYVFGAPITSGLTVTVTGLTADTNYSYRVKGGNDTGTGAYSDLVVKKTSPIATVVASDDFNRADGALGVTPVGGRTWNKGGATLMVISGNKAVGTTTPGYVGNHAGIDIGMSRGYKLSAVITPTAGAEVRLVTRCSAASFNGVDARIVNNELVLVDSNGAGDISSKVGGFVVGTPYLIEIEVRADDTYKVFRDGTEILSVPNVTAKASNTGVGISSGNTVATFDDFKVIAL